MLLFLMCLFDGAVPEETTPIVPQINAIRYMYIYTQCKYICMYNDNTCTCTHNVNTCTCTIAMDVHVQ